MQLPWLTFTLLSHTSLSLSFSLSVSLFFLVAMPSDIVIYLCLATLSYYLHILIAVCTSCIHQSLHSSMYSFPLRPPVSQISQKTALVEAHFKGKMLPCVSHYSLYLPFIFCPAVKSSFVWMECAVGACFALLAASHWLTGGCSVCFLCRPPFLLGRGRRGLTDPKANTPPTAGQCALGSCYLCYVTVRVTY